MPHYITGNESGKWNESAALSIRFYPSSHALDDLPVYAKFWNGYQILISCTVYFMIAA